jgi:thioredoxin-like negative regulator of GroEL
MTGMICNVLILAAMSSGLVYLLATNLGGIGATSLTNFLDRPDWTPASEEIALRPILRLIDEIRERQALAELEELLAKHQPTYEALLLKAKLLYHVGGGADTAAALLQLIELSKTTQQQLAVMDLLAQLEDLQPPETKPLAPGTRRLSLHHELILFPPDAKDRSLHKTIPAGDYEVGEIPHGNRRWLKLAAEDWGNAQICWEAVQQTRPPAAPPQTGGVFASAARMSERMVRAIKGKPRIHSRAEAQRLLKEANQFIRREDWPLALPVLQKASACDPDCYEIAFRWAQAVRRTPDDATTTQVVDDILRQSRWTDSERQMILQLKRSASSTKF